MNFRSAGSILFISLCAASLLTMPACNQTKATPNDEAPPPAQVEQESDNGAFEVDRPNEYPLATAEVYAAAPELHVTGTVSPDVSRNIPVVSLASGRVVDLQARLGDSVVKGQLLMRIQSADISQAFSDYRQSVADETLAKTQLDRAKLLYSHGSIALNDLQVAQDVEEKASVTLETAVDHLRVLGADINHPAAIVDVRAPASGVITDQQVTNAAGVQGLSSPNLFTISDLSHVWVLCDVYENDLPFVRLGEYADIHLTAYPNMVLKGRVGNISPILDPSLRTAKVRLEVSNPGILRLGMFVTATFYGLKKDTYAAVPATAVLHLHDRDWVFIPVGGEKFRRIGVVSGSMLTGNRQEIISGLKPGDRIVENALDLEAEVEQ